MLIGEINTFKGTIGGGLVDVLVDVIVNRQITWVLKARLIENFDNVVMGKIQIF